MARMKAYGDVASRGTTFWLLVGNGKEAIDLPHVS